MNDLGSTHGPTIWLDGALLRADEPAILAGDRGFLLGEGIFETMLAVDGRVPLLARHVRRMTRSARELGIPITATLSELESAISRILRSDGLTEGTAAVRLTLSGGSGERGPSPPPTRRSHLLVSAAACPAPDARPQPGLAAGTPAPSVSLRLASFRVAAGAPSRRYKSSSYLDNVVARGEAAAAGADEALLLNASGRVAEASAANVLALRGDELLTPPVDEGALPGITRGLLLELAPGCGLAAREVPLTLDDLVAADALLLTSCLIGLRAVTSLSDKHGAVLGAWVGAPPAQAVVRLRAAHAHEAGLPAGA